MQKFSEITGIIVSEKVRYRTAEIPHESGSLVLILDIFPDKCGKIPDHVITTARTELLPHLGSPVEVTHLIAVDKHTGAM